MINSNQHLGGEDCLAYSSDRKVQLVVVTDGLSNAFGPAIPRDLETRALVELSRRIPVSFDDLTKVDPSSERIIINGESIGATVAKNAASEFLRLGLQSDLVRSVFDVSASIKDIPQQQSQFPSQRGGACLAGWKVTSSSEVELVAVGDCRYGVLLKNGEFFLSTNFVEEADSWRRNAFDVCAKLGLELGIPTWSIYRWCFAFHRNVATNVLYGLVDGSQIGEDLICYRKFPFEEVRATIVFTDGALSHNVSSEIDCIKELLLSLAYGTDEQMLCDEDDGVGLTLTRKDHQDEMLKFFLENQHSLRAQTGRSHDIVVPDYAVAARIFQ